MISCEAQRTLVKSPPELWALLSDPESLARHLGELGEIRIVRTEPESAVEWEGEGITGTVQLKASGWGTKVTLTATRQPPAAPQQDEPEPEPVLESESKPEPVLESEPEPEPEPQPEPEPKLGFFARIFRRRPKLAPITEPEMREEPPAEEPQSEEPRPEESQVEEPQVEEPQADIAAELLALEESSAAATTAVLTAVLDKLGAAHHRPFSRA